MHVEPEVGEQLDWAEVEMTVRPVITTWVDGAEMAWASYAWDTLAKSGLTTYASELDRTRSVLRAVAVAALYLDYCAQAFDEGSTGDWRERVTADLIGPPPAIDAFTLGQLVEREGIEFDNSPLGGETLSEVLVLLVSEEYNQVTRALRTAWGDAGLFASLFVSTSSEASYPMSEDAVADVVNDATFDKMHAWEWVTSLG